MIPNEYQYMVEAANKYGREFSEAHRPDLGLERAEKWIRLVAYDLFQKDRKWGLVGKRGGDTISQDALMYRAEGVGHDPTNGNEPVTVVDVIGAAGSAAAKPTWQVFNDPQLHKGPAKYIQPQPVEGYHDVPAIPPPPPLPPPVVVAPGVENAISLLIKALVSHADQVGSLQKKDAESRKLFLDGLEQQFVRFNQALDRVEASNQARLESDQRLKDAVDGLEQRLVKGWAVSLKGGWPVGNINGDVSAK